MCFSSLIWPLIVYPSLFNVMLPSACVPKSPATSKLTVIVSDLFVTTLPSTCNSPAVDFRSPTFVSVTSVFVQLTVAEDTLALLVASIQNCNYKVLNSMPLRIPPFILIYYTLIVINRNFPPRIP